LPEQLAAVLAPTLIATALGWAWGRFGPGLEREGITDLIMQIGAPCLAFHGLVSVSLEPALMLRMAGASLLALACFALLGAPLLVAARLPLRTFLAPVVFGNTGNMGLPLSLFAFGETGLALALCIYAVTAVIQYSVGIAIWSGELSLAGLLRTPLTLAALLAVAVIASGWQVPQWILNTTQLLGGFAVPLMLLSLGMAIGELRITRLRRTAGIALLRLSLGCATGYALAALLGFEGVARGVLVLQCSMPIAVFNYLLAQRYERTPDEVAGAIVVSTLLSLVLLPALLARLLAESASW
jgi:predicted permease